MGNELVFKLLEHFMTFKVNNMYNYLVRLDNNGVEMYGVIESSELVVPHRVLETRIEEIIVNSNFSILINKFVDITNSNKVTCNTTKLDVNHNDSFISFNHGLRITNNGFKINLGDARCPDWDDMDIPKEYLFKLTTKNSIVYVLKTRENVTVVA